jgi:hypothetical protein
VVVLKTMVAASRFSDVLDMKTARVRVSVNVDELKWDLDETKIADGFEDQTES